MGIHLQSSVDFKLGHLYVDCGWTSFGRSASVTRKKDIRHWRAAVTMALLPARPTCGKKNIPQFQTKPNPFLFFQYLSGNVCVVPQGEVPPGQGDPPGGAVVVELLAGGLQQPQPPQVALPGRDPVEVRQAAELCGVAERVRDQGQPGALPDGGLSPEVADGQGDRLAEEAVRGVAHQLYAITHIYF